MPGSKGEQSDHRICITDDEFALLCWLRENPDVAATYGIKDCNGKTTIGAMLDKEGEAIAFSAAMIGCITLTEINSEISREAILGYLALLPLVKLLLAVEPAIFVVNVTSGSPGTSPAGRQPPHQIVQQHVQLYQPRA